MVVLGFLLIAVAVLAALGVAISSSSTASLEGFGFELETTTALVYFAGAASALVAIVGLWLMTKGTARSYRRRREVRSLRQEVDTSRTDTSPETRPDTTPETTPEAAADERADGETPAART
jgi:ABC-type nickel/cobalt efflux system permease component RcnA